MNVSRMKVDKINAEIKADGFNCGIFAFFNKDNIASEFSTVSRKDCICFVNGQRKEEIGERFEFKSGMILTAFKSEKEQKDYKI
jgi:hypothetical protein